MNKYERNIQKIKNALHNLEPLLPGSISTQWNVCGKPGCRCKDLNNPQKHGPYYQLSFTIDKKSSSMFLKQSAVSEVQECIKRYKQFRKLNNDLLNAYVLWARNGGLEKTGKENI